MLSVISKALFYAAWGLGKPFGGLRPRRIYDWLGRAAFPRPEFKWHRNRWGNELRLSLSYHLDRNIIIFGCYDENLHLALEQLVKPGMVCMDVGANLGEVSLHLARLVGPQGVVHVFEPIPAQCERLKDHVARNGAQDLVRIHEIALSNRTGQVLMACPDPQQDNQALGSIVNLDPKRVPLQIQVPAITLDDFAAQQRLERVELIKIDIQGAEIFLLEGGREFFSRFSPDLLMEISPGDLRCIGKDSRDLCRMLEEYGYAIYSIRRGKVGGRISAASVTPDFEATNVFCTRKQ